MLFAAPMILPGLPFRKQKETLQKLVFANFRISNCLFIVLFPRFVQNSARTKETLPLDWLQSGTFSPSLLNTNCVSL
jgi:hypothetical protein